MKQSKIVEYARRALVMVLMIAMVSTSMPMAQIAAALPLPEPAAAAGGQQDGTAQDGVPEGGASQQDQPSAERAPQDDVQPKVPAEEKADKQEGEQAVESPEEVIDGSKLDKAELTEAPELTDEELMALMPDLVDPASAADKDERANEPAEGDGTTIERASVEWITQGAGSNRLTVAPKTDDPQDVRMRVNVAFSGQHDYEPGKMRLTVPKSIFTYRDGSVAGSMTTSVPEAPDTRALFSYVELDDSYVLTNTRKLSAATSAMFEFTIHDIVPHQMNGSGTTISKPFWAVANVTTHAGTLLGKKSNEIDATFDTSEQIKTAENSIALLTEAWDEEWPSELKPSNAKDYVYADFYSWATVEGNQEFSVKVQHSASVKNVEGGSSVGSVQLLGIRDQNGQVQKGTGSASGTWTLSSSGYTATDTRDFFVHAYVAVPKGKVPANKKYDFIDDVTYTVTSIDDRASTSKSGSAKQTYAPLSFVNPGGHFNVFKSGSIPHNEDENVYQWGDPDPLALNDLRDGRDVLSTWEVETLSFNAPWTAPAGKPTSVEQMEQRKVKTVTDDTSVQFNNSGKDLTSADFEFASIELKKPEVYHYEKFTENTYGWSETTKDGYVVWQKIPAGTFGYKPVTDNGKVPDVEVWGMVNGSGSWQHLATVNWTSGTPRLTHQASGVSLDGSTVVFDKGKNVTDVRTVFNTERSGIILYAYPTVRLKPTAAIKQQVEQLYANSTSPTTALRNKAVMRAYEDNGKEILTTQVKAADNKLSGVSLGVRAFKKVKTENDIPNRLARLHYTTTVKEQTNLTTKEQYNEAIERGIFAPETSGTFYDLLPKHVIPDLSSIKLRKGDSLKNAYTVENYKGSGRTLLVVEATLSPQPKYVKAPGHWSVEGTNEETSVTGEAGYCDSLQLEFDAVYTWEDLTDLGADLNNVIAFESGNASLGTMKGLSGEPDNPLAGKNETSKEAVKGVESLMTDLNPNHNNPVFVYANCRDTVNVDVSAITGLYKQVSVNNSGVYDTGVGDYAMNVYEGGTYTYRLRIHNSNETKLKGVVLYDDLENYVPKGTDKQENEGDRQWRGVLQSVDTSSLEAQGVKPVVYYSTKADLDLDDGSQIKDEKLTGDLNIKDSSIWSTVKPDDPKAITGVAIDCSKSKDGSDFVLGASKSMGVLLNMKAPLVSEYDQSDDASKWYDSELKEGQTEAGDNGLAGGAHAYNNVSRVGWEINAQSGSTSEFKLVHEEYTKVGLLNSSLLVKKVWNDGDNQDGVRPDGVTIHLLANGQETGRSATLNSGNNWQHEFANVPRMDADGHAITYSVREDLSNGYTYGVEWKDGETGSDPQVGVVTNSREPEKTKISGLKTWDDANDAAGRRPDSVKIDLYKNGEKFKSKTVRADDNGNWSYTFDNLDKYYDEGKLVQYEVKEDTYYAGYVPSANGDYGILNTYDPFGDLEISKEVLGATPQSSGKSFTFRVDIETPEGKPDSGQYDYVVQDAASGTEVQRGKISAGGKLALQDGQTARIKEIPSESSYYITEENTPGFALTGRVNDTGDIQAGKVAHAQFTNTYNASGAVRLEANKTLEGRDLEAYQFRFEILDENGEVIRTASNDSEGKVLFGALRYGLKDLGSDGTATKRYTIREQALKDNPNGAYVVDTHEYSVVVNLRDNGEGTIEATASYENGNVPTFRNAYSANGSIVLRAWKELKSGDLSEYGPFTFELRNDKGQVLSTASSKDDGTIEFDSISFDQDDAGKTFTFTAHEVEGTTHGVNYDKTVFTYSVRVIDNGDGTLSFEQTSSPDTPIFQNTLKPGDLRLEKRTEGGDPSQEFTFHVKLIAEDGQELPEDGEMTFDREQLTDTAAADKPIDDSDAGPSAEMDEAAKLNQNGETGETEVSSVEAAPASESSKEGSAPGAETDASKDVSVPRATPQSGTAHNGEEYSGAARWSLAADGTLTVNSGIITNPSDQPSAYQWLPQAVRPQVTKVVFQNTNIKNGYGVFYGLDNVTQVSGSINLAGYDAEGDLSNLFDPAPDGLKDVTLSFSNASVVKDVSLMFNGLTKLESVNLNGFSISNCTDMSSMFSGCTSLRSVTLGGLNSAKVKDMSSMFKGCSSLESIDLSNFNTSVVTDMSSMFYGCSSLTSLDASAFNTARVTTMANMFYGCSGLNELEVGAFNTSAVTDMSSMFYECSNLQSLDVSGFATANVTTMKYMFGDCSALSTLDVSSFDLTRVKTMYGMFYGCSALKSVDFGSSATPVLTDLTFFLYNCAALTEIKLEGFTVGSAVEMDFVFPSKTTNPCEITLGGGWKFNSSSKLPAPSSSKPYNGKWICKEVSDTSYTPAQLASAWTSAMAGTYVWDTIPTEYTVAFDPGTTDPVSGSMAPQTWNIDVYGTIPECGFKRFGYDFVEWEDEDGNTYEPGAQIKNLTLNAGDTVTLYATWKPWDNTIDMKNGEFDITIHGNEAAIVRGLPAGVGYIITEKTPAGWELVESSGATGTIKPDDTVTAKFKNSYNPGATRAVITASKYLDGAPAKADAFEFELVDSSTGKVIQTKRNSDGGGVVFDSDELRYTSAGRHYYEIREKRLSSEHPDVEFDTHVEKVDVLVKDDGKGNLYVSRISYTTSDSSSGQAVFENFTKPGSLEVTKQVKGTDASDKEFQFRIDWDGGKTWSSFTLRAGETKRFDKLAPGTTYKISEIGMPDGYVQEGIVGETGTIVSAQIAHATVNNRYAAAGSAVLQAQKMLEGGALEDGQFTFVLKDSSGQEIGRATNGADGTVTFDPIEYSKPGTYKYTMSEQVSDDEDIEFSKEEHEVTVKVTDAGDGSLKTEVTYDGLPTGELPVFTNKVKPGGTIHLSKQVINGTEATKDIDFSFKVKLMDIDGKELKGTFDWTKSDGSTGSMESGGEVELKAGENIDIKVPLGTTYEITEAKTPGFTASSENAEGSVPSGDVVNVVFTNTYDAKGEFAPAVSKVLEGGGLREGQFTFELRDADGELIERVTNSQNGTVQFSNIEYGLTDDGKDFEYRIREVDDQQANIEYDKNEVMVRVHVADNGDGTMAVTATYDGKDSATFTNKRLVSMPETGQAGIIAGTVVGLAVLGVSAYALVRRRKR